MCDIGEIKQVTFEQAPQKAQEMLPMLVPAEKLVDLRPMVKVPVLRPMVKVPVRRLDEDRLQGMGDQGH